MAFFLLGRVDDTLNLLCPDTFATRQDAMSALSRITGEPGFDLWDAEVLLLDTDSGTPVLLVRPNAAPEVLVEAEAASDVEVLVIEDLAEEPLETIVVDEISDEVVAEDESEADSDESESGDAEAESDEPDADEQPAVGDEAIADAIVEEAEEAASADAEEAADAASADADLPDEAESAEEIDPAQSLRDALTRTAAQMESEGIVAPESIGAAESAPEVADEVVAEVAPEPTEESADKPADEPTDEPAAETETEEAPAPEAAWPWDVAAEAAPAEPAMSPEIAFVLSDLEEPSLDDGSILRGSIDDETFAAARPVIMGSYADTTITVAELDEIAAEPAVVEPMGIVEAEPVAAPSPAGFAVPVVGDAADIFQIDPVEPAQDEAPTAPESESVANDDVESRDISDFILDLGSEQPAEQPAEEAAPAPNAGGLDEYTCKDCVYEETCPNKDQRLPKDCGSFQWR